MMNYTEIEAKVREATNDEAWGPTGQIMQELAHSTFTYEHFPEVMSMLWKRMLQDNKQHWRRTYKVNEHINHPFDILLKSRLFAVATRTQLPNPKRFGARCYISQGAHIRFTLIGELHVHRRHGKGPGRQYQAQSERSNRLHPGRRSTARGTKEGQEE